MNIPFADNLLHAYVAHRSRRTAAASIAELRIERVQRILLVLTTGLGDAVLSTPVFPALRKRLPAADIRLLCRAAWVPLFAHDPDLNGVFTYPGKYRRFLTLVRELRRFKPEVAVVLHGNDPDIVPLAYLAGARFITRIPTTGTRYGFLLANRDREEDRATLPGLHYIENRLRILDTLGVAPVDRTPRIHVDSGTRERVRRKVEALTQGRPYWVVHAFAADRYKNWPTEKIRTFLQAALARNADTAVVLTGGPDDRARLEQMASGQSGMHVLAGRLDIAETAACLAGAACVVAPDTGVLHLAAAVGAPVIGLYAPTFATLVGPRSNGAAPVVIQKPQTCDPCVEKNCPYTPVKCMNQIGVEEVLDALAKVLAR
jgi:ADP-heptose:LPS heptosyltransferase